MLLLGRIWMGSTSSEGYFLLDHRLDHGGWWRSHEEPRYWSQSWICIGGRGNWGLPRGLGQVDWGFDYRFCCIGLRSRWFRTHGVPGLGGWVAGLCHLWSRRSSWLCDGQSFLLHWKWPKDSYIVVLLEIPCLSSVSISLRYIHGVYIGDLHVGARGRESQCAFLTSHGSIMRFCQYSVFRKRAAGVTSTYIWRDTTCLFLYSGRGKKLFWLPRTMSVSRMINQRQSRSSPVQKHGPRPPT